MAHEYAIGDIQGCLDPLKRLLDKIKFNDNTDRLWFVGDLINRGPASLETLRFIYNLPLAAHITLGNHDLYLLHCVFNEQSLRQEDTVNSIINAPDRDELCHWLRQQPLLYHDPVQHVVMTHAGIYPHWSLEEAKQHAAYFSLALQGPDYKKTLSVLYGNHPNQWSETHPHDEKLRFIANAFTRMRFCTKEGLLQLNYKGDVAHAPSNHYPWYAVPHRCMIEETLVFGHWAALEGECPIPNVYALDTGCVWGKKLTALRLHDKQRFYVPGA
jgi:bis(5'-nucleosyl)-tetraphosphatase (symmetrical)